MEDSFFFSKNLHNFLFYGVNVETTFGLTSLMLGFGSLCFLWEGLRVAQLHLINAHKVFCCSATSISSKDKLISVAVQTLLHTLALVIGYVIMLAIMSYNAWFLVAGAVGSSVGFWCFGYLNQALQILLIPKCGRHRDSCDKHKLTLNGDEVADTESAQPILADGAPDCRPECRSLASYREADVASAGSFASSGNCRQTLRHPDGYRTESSAGNKLSVRVDLHAGANGV